MHRAVFIQANGILFNPSGDPTPTPSLFEDIVINIPAKSEIEKLAKAKFLLIALIQEKGIANGSMSKSVSNALINLLKQSFPLTHVYCCYHSNVPEEQKCSCMQSDGFVIEAKANWRIELSASFLASTRIDDTRMARAAGCKAIAFGSVSRDPCHDIFAPTVEKMVKTILSY